MTIAAVGVGGWLLGSIQKSAPKNSAPTISLPASAGTTVVALPISPKCTREAEVHYREGLTALQQATWELAYPAFEKAVAADPMCPEPLVQLPLVGYASSYPLGQLREQFRRALALRDALSERDRAVLDAFGPLIVSEPEDRKESAHRLDAVAIRFPNDAQVLDMTATAHMLAAPDAPALEHALDLSRRATTIDSRYADAWQAQAQALLYLGRLDAGLAALDQCIEVAPGSGDCMQERIRALRQHGRQCAEVVADARRWSANVPTSSWAYIELANALASQGAPAETVEAALQQAKDNGPGDRREIINIYYRGLLSALHGDFENAERLAEQLIGRGVGSSALFDHVRASALLVDVLTEIGKKERAADVAERVSRQKEAWTQGIWANNQYEPLLLAAQLQPKNKGTRERWRQSSELWERTVSGLSKRQIWGFRWGPVSATRELATEAWHQRPDEPLTAGTVGEQVFFRNLVRIYEGHIALAAGESAQAVELLQVASQNCDALQLAFTSTQSYLWLGQAKEQTGDRAGACDAYAAVVQRWGNAKPRSITADEAKHRSRVLGCKVR